MAFDASEHCKTESLLPPFNPRKHGVTTHLICFCEIAHTNTSSQGYRKKTHLLRSDHQGCKALPVSRRHIAPCIQHRLQHQRNASERRCVHRSISEVVPRRDRRPRLKETLYDLTRERRTRNDELVLPHRVQIAVPTPKRCRGNSNVR